MMIFRYFFPGRRFLERQKNVFRYRHGLPLSRSPLFADLQFLFADLRSGYIRIFLPVNYSGFMIMKQIGEKAGTLGGRRFDEMQRLDDWVIFF